MQGPSLGGRASLSPQCQRRQAQSDVRFFAVRGCPVQHVSSFPLSAVSSLASGHGVLIIGPPHFFIQTELGWETLLYSATEVTFPSKRNYKLEALHFKNGTQRPRRTGSHRTKTGDVRWHYNGSKMGCR